MLVHEELTREILGAFYRVYTALGYGFLEAVYANAMAVELVRRGLSCEREAQVDVRYAGVVVGRYRTDILVDRRVVLELKASASLDPMARQQLSNYLRATGLEVGLLLHFGRRPEFQRLLAPYLASKVGHRGASPIRTDPAFSASSEQLAEGCRATLPAGTSES